MRYGSAEHWVMVSGVAVVTSGDRVFNFSEDQSTYIPLSQTRRFAYEGSSSQEIIEVQSGGCLGEGHIAWFGSDYGHDLKLSPEWMP
jgi:mannose-1-phosphate guanylyltransferase / mannose-6-phosphate isomerase